MDLEEQEHIRQKNYTEAMRYMANAKDVLQKAGFEEGRYKDHKYVRMACGTAYNGVLEALDAWLKIKGIEPPRGKRKSIKFYEQNIGNLDKKMSNVLASAYEALHIYGYYDGCLDSDIIKIGFARANEIIDKIKPKGDA